MITNLLSQLDYDPLFSNIMYNEFPYWTFLILILVLQTGCFFIYNRIVEFTDRRYIQYVAITVFVLLLSWIIAVGGMFYFGNAVSAESGYTSFLMLHAFGLILFTIPPLVLIIILFHFIINPK